MGAGVTTARVLVPAAMLGGGFPADTIRRGISLGADIIAVDAGPAGSGPRYLGTAAARTSRVAVLRDLRAILVPANGFGVPVAVGSCGTPGRDADVEWVYDIAAEVAADEYLSLSVARIYSDQDPARIEQLLAEGRVPPREPSGPLPAETVRRYSHIVGFTGREPVAAVLEQKAGLVIGRAPAAALAAGLLLSRGLPPGPAWHARQIAECGRLHAATPLDGGVLVTLDPGGFAVEPLAAGACTATTVAPA